MEDAMLPPGYFLDESDPDIITLRRDDGAFSAQGATRGGIFEAALQDSMNPADPDRGTAHVD